MFVSTAYVRYVRFTRLATHKAYKWVITRWPLVWKT